MNSRVARFSQSVTLSCALAAVCCAHGSGAVYGAPGTEPLSRQALSHLSDSAESDAADRAFRDANYAEAEKHYQAARKLARAENDSAYYAATRDLADFYYLRKDYREAVHLYNWCMRVKERDVGAQSQFLDPLLWRSHDCYLHLDQPGPAQECLVRLIALRARTLPRGDEELIGAKTKLAEVLESVHRPDQAAAVWAEIADTLRGDSGVEENRVYADEKRCFALLRAANLYVNAGNISQAESLYSEVPGKDGTISDPDIRARYLKGLQLLSEKCVQTGALSKAASVREQINRVVAHK